ncbi:T-cell surface glycoprotein CD3 gamma chain-like [Syngnathoides biaculeatus]|uniref:T-cell surface glycoprotein CD3 gamma chain-like n=1 Tax=Syngnathoides biaculeatus TaxID=300417 RepID=UPI002ADD6753|nr:T-cell surface glycoprotein CD3 gamma chain-like [Syngnathoides biaculeatus]
MKGHTVLPSYFILWTLTEFVRCDEGSKVDVVVKPGPGEITILCGQNNNVTKNGEQVTFPLKYKDQNSGEYECVGKDQAGQKTGTKIFVKFRSCENCVELDLVSLSGLAVGNLMATIVLGVAVYLVATQMHDSVTTSQPKSSDQRHLIPNDPKRRVRNDEYQELRHKGGHKDIYDTLSNQ